MIEQKKPQHWVGASLKTYGINPYGENLFRVILASTRTQIVGMEFPDGFIGYRWQPVYPGKDHYVLEKWLSADDYCGTMERWETDQRNEHGLLTLGPFPNRGEYIGIHHFSPGYPATSAVETIINMALRSRPLTFQQRRDAMIAADKKESLAKVNSKRDLIMESLPAYGLTASSIQPAKRKPEDYKMRLTTKDLALPKGHNKFFTRRAVNGSTSDSRTG